MHGTIVNSWRCILSPILFATYIDDLLNDLRNLGVGCFFESSFTGALGYADDVVLYYTGSFISCSLEDDATLLRRICRHAAFSTWSLPSCTAHFMFHGQQLILVDTVTHLGHLIHHDLSDIIVWHGFEKAKCLLASFPHFGPVILTYLFQTYCLPLHVSAL